MLKSPSPSHLSQHSYFPIDLEMDDTVSPRSGSPPTKHKSILSTGLAVAAARRFTLSPKSQSSPKSPGSPKTHDIDLESGHAHFSDNQGNDGPSAPRRSLSVAFAAEERDGGSTSTRGAHNARRRSSAAAPKYRWLSGGGRGSNTGNEPGVDVRIRSARDEEVYGHLKSKTRITVVDYASDPEAEDTNVRVDFPGSRLAGWLESDAGQRPQTPGVRWIHVEGLNWEVVKTLTLQFKIHPLAVEDALRSGKNPRSKLDFYKDHIYLQILVHHIHAADKDTIRRAADGIDEGLTVNAIPVDATSAPHPVRRWPWNRPKPELIRLPEGVESVFEPTTERPNGRETKHHHHTHPYEKETHRLVIDQLSASYMVPIRRGMISVFMLRDGTLVSLSAHEVPEVVGPIYERLEDEHSILRRSGDVSMLAHALLDVSVDLSLEIIHAFETEILKTESSVLVQAELEIVRHLHIIQTQITRFRRQISSLLHLCYVIRDQDVQRSQAATTFMTGTRSKAAESFRSATPSSYTPSTAFTPTLRETSHMVSLDQDGFFSPMARVYINDVIDHLETIVSSGDQFNTTCEHLTDYVFNVLSFHTNVSMERLSIVTVVFLPLTFIASYFGMNFDDFDELANSVSYFWKVAGPCTVVFFLIFSYGYLVIAAETLLRKMTRWRRERDISHAAEVVRRKSMDGKSQ